MTDLSYEDYNYVGINNRNESYNLYDISEMKANILEVVLLSVLMVTGMTLLFFINYTIYKVCHKDSLFSRYKRKLKIKKIGEMSHKLVDDINRDEKDKKVIEMNIYIDDTTKSESTISESISNKTTATATQTDRIDDNGGGETKRSNV